MKKLLLSLAGLVSVFIFSFSCKNIGLGAELDLEAPEITITSPLRNANVGLHFILEGTCYDNQEVTSIEVSNFDTGAIFGQATIDGNNWSFPMSLSREDEGEMTIKCVANDRFGNSSTKSSQVITLLIDETAPEGLTWYIDRGHVGATEGNGIQTQIYSDLSKLVAVDTSLSVNKDIPQNEVFFVHGSFYDANTIDYITLKIYEVNTSGTVQGDILYQTTVSADSANANYIGDGNSIYSPVWKVDGTTTSFAGLGNGKHYLKLVYESVDEATNGKNKNTNIGYALWYPESDYPGVDVNNDINDEGYITIRKGGALAFTIFDDDTLQVAKYGLLTPTEYNAIAGADKDAKIAKITENEGSTLTSESLSSGTRDQPINVTADSNYGTGTYYFVSYAKDDGGKVSVKIQETAIVDDSIPQLVLEEPKENTIPSIKAETETKIQFKGFALDSTGCDYVKIIYLPSTITDANKESRVNQLLGITGLTLGTIKKENDGCRIVSVTLTDSGNVNSYNKKTFTQDFDLVNDFPETERNKEKLFRIYAHNPNNKSSYKEIKLQADTGKPTIEITSPANMASINYDNDLTITFKAYKSSGLGLDTTGCSIKVNGETFTFPTLTSNVGSIIISSTKLTSWKDAGSTKPEIEITAKDKLGNTNTIKQTIVLSKLPYLEKITVDKETGTSKKGDSIKFTAKFNSNVKITSGEASKLYLKIKDSNPAAYVEATYLSGAGSDSLIYEYIVEEGKKGVLEPGYITANSVSSAGDSIGFADLKQTETSFNSSVLNDSYHKGTSAKTITIDGVIPTVSSIKFTSEKTTYTETNSKVNLYLKAGDKLYAEVTMLEDVQVNPSLKLKMFNSDESKSINFDFYSASGETIKFLHTVSTSDFSGSRTYDGDALYYKKSALFDFTGNDTDYIKDIAGNKYSKETGDLTKAQATYNTSSKTENIFIDTVVPGKGNNNTTGSTYVPKVTYEYNDKTDTIEFVSGTKKVCKKAGTITVTAGSAQETCKTTYSQNNGNSYSDYSSTGVTSFTTDAAQNFIVKLEDKAGNTNTFPYEFYLLTSFPELVDAKFNTADGYYKGSGKIEAELIFADKVKCATKSNLSLKVVDPNDATKELTFSCASISGTSIKFEYTITGSEDFKGLKISELLDSATGSLVCDWSDYSVSSSEIAATPATINASIATISSATRTGIIIDNVAPFIDTYLPADNGIGQKKPDGSYEITLTFSEHVIKEKGKITLQRKGQWAIPPVLTSDEFYKIYTASTNANKNVLIKTTGHSLSSPTLSYATGISVGPYKQITHGLKLSGTSYVPDTSTKYVLDFDLGLYKGSATINNGTQNETFTAKVSDIRSALEAVGYHKISFDVSSNYVSDCDEDNKVKIIIPATENLADGIEWEFLMDEGTFCDDAGHKVAAITGATWSDEDRETQTKASGYTLWTGKVATPVVRVNRYSHGYGAYGLNGTTKTLINARSNPNQSNTPADTATAYKPLGYAEVRIDCETPGVTLYYKNLAKSSTNIKTATQPTAGNKNANRSNNTNALQNDLESSFTPGEQDNAQQTKTINVGTQGDYYTASKNYVIAYATKTGMTQSANGFEGVFKTVIRIEAKNNSNTIDVQGGSGPGGQPSICGFPLKDNCTSTDDMRRYSKNMYREDQKNFYWVSYDIVSEDCGLLWKRSNYGSEYPLYSYGQGTYIFNPNCYADGDI